MPNDLPTADEFFAAPSPPPPAPGVPTPHAPSAPHVAGQLPTAEEFFGAPTVQESWSRQVDRDIQRGMFRVLDAFGYSAREGFGHEPIATPATSISPETQESLRAMGLWNDYKKGQANYAKSVVEQVMRGGAAAGYLTARLATGALSAPLQGIGQAGEELSKAGEALGLPAFAPAGSLTGDEGLRGAATDPGVMMLFGPEIAGFTGLANAQRARNLAPLETDLARARATGVIGEGEAGFHDAVPLTPENKAARVEAAKDAGVAPDIEPPVAPPKDVHELARRVDPETFAKLDTLNALKDNIRAGLDELGGSPEHPIALPLLDESEIRLQSREAQISSGMEETTAKILAAKKPSAEAFRAQESLSRLEAIENQLRDPELEPAARKALKTRRDEILADTTPEKLREQAAPIENLRVLRNQGAALARERDALREERARIRAESLGAADKEGPPIDLQTARRRLAHIDDGIRELIPDIAEAYRQAHEMMPGAAAKEAARAVEALQTATAAAEAPKAEPAPMPQLPPVQPGYVRFFHGGEADPASGGGRWVSPDYTYAADYRGRGTPVHYVDIPKGDPTELAARDWDEIDEMGGTNMVGRYRSVEVPEEWAKKMKPAKAGPTAAPTSAEPAKPAPQRTTTALRPVQGTGETKVRGLAENVEAKAIENTLADNFGDLPEYQQLSMADQAERARNLIAEDYEAAKAVAMGTKAPPRGVLPESVYVAVEKVATAEGDVDLLRQLATESKLTTAATTMGQRIRTLGERDKASPVAAIQEVQAAREAAIAKRADLAAAKRTTVKEIKTAMRSGASTKQDWASFISSITCVD